MLLAIDIGNTATHFALLNGKKIIKRFEMNTTLKKKEYAFGLKKLFADISRRCSSVDEAVVCSVVPKATKIVKAHIRKALKISVVIIGEDALVPIKNKYANPKQVGQDRLVCAYAALVLYGVPAIIIDFGTAITFDVVSSKKEYLGGIIIPGIHLSAESLFKKTALLPKVQIKAPSALIGRDTENSILSGLFYGYGAMSLGLIDLIAKQIKGSPKVIITGGFTELMKKFIASKNGVVDKDLVFHGMRLVWEKHVLQNQS